MGKLKLHHGQAASPFPNGVTVTPVGTFPVILANATSGTVLANLTEIGGTGVSVVFTLAAGSSSNVEVVGTQLKIKAGASFTPGTTPTYGINVTDTGGSYTEASTARSYTVPAGPTGITHTPDTVLNTDPVGHVGSTLTPIGGTGPGTWVKTTGLTKFDIIASGSTSALSLNAAVTAGETGSTVSGTVTYTDAAGLSTPAVSITETVQDAAASTFVTNFALPNTSATTTQASPFTTDIYMAQFAQGDIASGTWPIFKIHGSGTVLSYSCGLKPRLWADGSMKLLPVAFVIPAGNDIAVNGSITIDAYTNGTQPVASSRTTAEFPSDLQVEADIVAGGTGTYIANVPDGVTNGKVFPYMDGPAGKVWKIITDFKKAGVAEGQLQSWFYIFSKNNAAGGLAGHSVNPRVTKPNLDKGGKQMSMFSRLQLKSGGNLILDPWANSPNSAPVTFTATASSNQYAVPSAAPGVGIFAGTHNAGYGCMVSSDNTLPGGLSANTPYFMRYAGTTNKINLGVRSDTSLGGNGLVTATSTGIGNHTITPLPYIVWGSSIRVLPMTGIWNWVQGSGTVATDCTVRFVPNKTYLHSTKIVPPYDLTVGSFASSAIPYVINGIGNSVIFHVQGGSGDRPELGPQTNWASLYYLNQDAGSESQIRTAGLCEGHYSNSLYMSTTGTIVNGLNDTAYTGISQPPAAHGTGSQFRWYYSGGTLNTSVTDKPTANFEMVFDENDTAHCGNYSFTPYIIFGHPDLFDTVMEKACAAIWQRIKAVSTATTNQLNGSQGGTSNFIVNGTTYLGCAYGVPGNSRADAWGRRDLNFGAGVAPQGGSYDGADHYSMLNDSVDNSYAMILAWRGLLSPTSYARLNGIFGYQNTGRDALWQHGYNQFADCIAVGLAEKTAPIAMMADIANCPGHMYDVAVAAGDPWPVRNLCGDHLEVRKDTVNFPSDYIDNDNRLGMTNGLALKFTSGSANITWSVPGAFTGPLPTPAVGDQWFFYGGGGAQSTPATPFLFDIPYYIVSSSGTTVQLSATKGGTAVTATSSVASCLIMGMGFNNPLNSSVSDPTSTSYTSILAGWLNWHHALGLTINESLRAAMNAQLAAQARNNPAVYLPNQLPKYTMADQF